MALRPILLASTLCVALTSACADPQALEDSSEQRLILSGAVVVRLESRDLRPGQSIAVEFTNESDALLGLNACERRVDRLIGGTWVPYPEELRLCTADLPQLPARGVLNATTDVPLDAVSGDHRFRFTVREMTAPFGTSEAIATFTIR